MQKLCLKTYPGFNAGTLGNVALCCFLIETPAAVGTRDEVRVGGAGGHGRRGTKQVHTCGSIGQVVVGEIILSLEQAHTIK